MNFWWFASIAAVCLTVAYGMKLNFLADQRGPSAQPASDAAQASVELIDRQRGPEHLASAIRVGATEHNITTRRSR